MEAAALSIERLALVLAAKGSTAAAVATAAIDGAVARLAPWLAPQQRHYLVGGVAVFTALVGAISVLFVWIASRQVRPRKLPPPSARGAELPTSPTSKRKRHSRSFTDLEALERELRQENALLDEQDRFVFPASLRQRCRHEDLKLIYDVLSKVFSFLTPEFVEPLATDLEILTFAPGAEIFARGAHDGSILLVVAGEATLSIHSAVSGEAFGKSVRRGETLASSLALLVAIAPNDAHTTTDLSTATDDDSATGDPALLAKVVGGLSAAASSTSGATVFRIPATTIARVVAAHPESYFRLAQAALSQSEKVTAKSLALHFGLHAALVTPSALVAPDALAAAAESADPRAAAARLLADALGVRDTEQQAALLECARSLTRRTGDALDSPPGVYLVVSGAVTAQAQVPTTGALAPAFTATTGCALGLAAAVVGRVDPGTQPAVCASDARLLWLPAAIVGSLLRSRRVAARVATHVVAQYSALVLAADSACDWLHVHGGESLFARGDPCDAVLSVLSGRLRAVQTHAHRGRQVETTRELGRGATLGALDMLAAGRSLAAVFATRDAQIAQMPRCVFELVVHEAPSVLVHFTARLASHLAPNDSGADLLSLSRAADESADHRGARSPLPVGTVAVLALTHGAHLSDFCAHLQRALAAVAPTALASSREARALLGAGWSARSRVARANVGAWLGDLEAAHELVLYEADAALSPWTQLCVRQADHVLLLVADAQPPAPGAQELADALRAAWEQKSAPISVVRVRAADWAPSTRTTGRAEVRPRSLLPVDRHEWVAGVHSVQLPFAQHSRDLLRVARRVTGHGVGVVLGGGGARGLAHLGVLRALEECGVHVDAVGGTSIGAFVGAAYALHAHEPAQLDRAARALAGALSSVAERLRDLTLPVSSFFSGARFNASVRAALGDAAIEELALDFFCVSTDIAKSRLHVHERGSVWKAVRASMTLQGYLPPISERGSVLLDGGYMNNLPADVMKDARGIRYIVAVDVGSEPRRDYYAYGAALSGWWLLWNKLNPFARTVSVPSMGDVSAALAYVSSERHKERVKAECVDLYLRPPVSAYGTLQFDKMDEIVDVGYRYALPRIRAWADQVLAAEPDADIVERSAKAPRRSGQPSPRAAGKSEEVAGA